MRQSLVVLLLIVLETHANAAEWTLKSDADGIRVLSRDESDSAVVSFRGEGTVDQPLASLYEILSKPELYHLWMPMYKDSKILEDRSRWHKIVSIHIGMPWPVKDRAFINEGLVVDGPDGSMVLSIRSISYPYQDESKVLGWTQRSQFLIRPGKTPSETWVEVELNQDPRGDIPKWMVNWVQASWPRKFFENLRRYSRNPGTKVND